MIALGSKSYPYLAVAQYFNIPYSQVLNFIDHVDALEQIGMTVALIENWMQYAYMVRHDEMERRKQVSGV